MPSDWSPVTDGYGRNWTPANEKEAEYSDPRRQMLPTHLMSDTATETSEEGDTFRAMGRPPPLPRQPPVGDLEAEMPVPNIKPKRKFIPDSWKNFLRGRGGRAKQIFNFNMAWGEEECSPPVSPLLSRRRTTSTDGDASELDTQQVVEDKDSSMFDCGTRTIKEMEAATTFRSDFPEKQPESAQSYMERIHVYQLKYAYMKSWPGLLRVLGIMQLLFGAMVFACICAYIQKDNQWYNFLGGSIPSYGFGDNYYYSGPKTPFVLVMAGLAWVVTVGLLVLGLTLYYRTILLDSDWWPLTEFTMNICLFFLYMAAGIVYVNGFSLGGLCYTMMANSPLYYQLCRVESGQIAAAAFLFFNMLLYLISAGMCLKVWRHEQTRREREDLRNKRKMAAVTEQKRPFSFKRMSFRRNTSPPLKEGVTKDIQLRSNGPRTLNKSIPAGYIPKPLIIPDYEPIREHKRIMKILEDYKEKINDPTFVEKKERCTYLKNKLSYIKQRIQEYDFECSSRDSY
ncbi:hypothetical protein scyTo_0015616 [Scyliorhinus torazame]|uniref:MARVEL domain-containing protein n=1 Tax=Scyliorhinus torazame TaxID=75743 RepID=A0A401PVM6_SCYTO|nr:hypothetical protein [Scyliorhinus torazame]